MKEKTTTLIWLRRDLRLADNPALAYAAARGVVVPVYILDPADPWAPGAASRWALHHALEDVGTGLAKLGAPLILRSGDPMPLLPALAKEVGADQVVWSRLYDPHAAERDAEVEKALRKAGVSVHTFNASLLFEPQDVQTKTGGPYKVFTPFAKACLAKEAPGALCRPPKRVETVSKIKSDKLKDWKLLPTSPDWAAGLRAFWEISEKGALMRLHDFIDESLATYKTDRDRPDRDGTSRLSPYLALGLIGPRQIWHAVHHAMETRPGLRQGSEVFIRELLWREFSAHLLHHFPTLPEKPLQPAFAKMPWRKDAAGLKAWQKGLTGYPIVDAGMRQLWRTGWMHNRVRMIVGSFLVKDLLLPWQAGEAWFWDTLVDADLANNAASWQWIGGCGADAAPYFRVFNPVLQGQKFDPDGAYIRHYVPELKGLKGTAIHAPWLLPEGILAQAGVKLGKTYPKPILDHAAARKRALESLKKIKKT